MRLEVETAPSIIPFQVQDSDTAGLQTDATKSKEALDEGIRAAQGGDRTQARSALLRSTELDAGNENAWLWLASISEYPEELMAFLENVLDINPANERALQWIGATRSLLAKTFVQRGIDAAEANKPMYAEDCFQKALEHDERNATAWLWLASLSESNGQRIEFLDRVLEIEPDNAAAANALQTIHDEIGKAKLDSAKNAAFSGNVEGALSILDAIVADSPENEDAWMLRSHLAARPDEKMSSLERVLAINPENTAARLAFESLNELFGKPEPRPVEPDSDETVQNVVDSSVAEVSCEESESSDNFESANEPNMPEYVHTEFEAQEDQPEFDATSEPAALVDDENGASLSTDAEDVPEAESYDHTSEELVFDVADEQEEVQQNYEEASDEDVPVMAPDWQPSIPVPDWNRETESYNLASLMQEAVSEVMFENAQQDVEAFDSSFAIPMPDATFDVPLDQLSARTGFETVVRASEGQSVPESSNCPFCSSSNEGNAFVCQSCFSVLTLSDLELLISNNHADKFVVRNAVEEMEKARSSRDLTENELTMLGIGHLNLRNLQYGYNYLHEASQLDPNNVVLSSQVNALLIRLEEIKLQDEVHAAMPKGKTILVVDDSATVRKLIAGKLEKCGHQVFCTGDGVEAMERLQDLVPDLILLDITMPRMDGYQACKMIRSNDKTKDIPVVMISGKDGFFDKVRGRMAGTTGYITKPFGPETLMKAVEFYLGGGSQDELYEPTEDVAN